MASKKLSSLINSTHLPKLSHNPSPMASNKVSPFFTSTQTPTPQSSSPPMASKKLSSFTSYTKPTKWACLSSYLSSLPFSTTPHFQNHPQTPLSHSYSTDQTPEEPKEAAFLDSSEKVDSKTALNAETYFQLILKLGLDRNIKEMEDLCHEMVKESCPFSETDFNQLIDSFLLEKDPTFEVVNDMIDSSLLPKDPNLEAAARVMDIMKNCKPVSSSSTVALLEDDKKMYYAERKNQFIKYLCVLDQIDGAFDQFKTLIGNGCAPDFITFDFIIPRLCKHRKVEECIMVLDRMIEHDYVPSKEDFYIKVIPFVIKAQDPYKVNQLLGMMRRAGFDPEKMPENDITTIEQIYDATIDAYCNLMKFEDAEKFLEENSVSTVSSHNILIDGYCVLGRTDDATNYLNKIVAKKLANIESWSIIIRLLCQQSQFDKALEHLKTMMNSWCQEHMSPDQTSSDGSVPKETIQTMLTMAMDSVDENCMEADAVLNLAMLIVLKSGLWKDAKKLPAANI